MERQRVFIISTLVFGLVFLLGFPVQAQIEVGDFIVSGEGEVTGLPRGKSGTDAKFQEYRDVPETLIVPELKLRIERKKQDFYLEFDSSKVGLDDQNYRLRTGRYGLLDLEFEWDQIPHFFSDTARTPYAFNGGSGDFSLSSKPASTAGTAVRDWANANANPLDLSMLQGIARFRARYTPTPEWSYTGSYSSQNTSGKRAFGSLFGSSPGSYNITELTEPLDYQTHNIELGGEYAGKGWSVGLKYNASLFHNNVSTITWDNPLNPGIGGACTNEAVYSNTAGTGPCRGRLDLYPSNQAHTFSLSGAAALPLKTRFIGTVSYGWRLQNDSFLPDTINPTLQGLTSVSRGSLDGDVRPLMVNATFVNNYIDRLNLKAFYRLYDLDNRSKRVFLPDGYIVNDSTRRNVELLSFPYTYSKQNIGLEAGYDLTRWLSAKLSYLWEKMHREKREVLNANEHSFGPSFDLKPNSWMLIRMSYRRSLRDANDYDAGRNTAIEIGETPEEMREELLGVLRKPDEAARNRNKVSLFAQISPWTILTLHGGFEFANDRFPRTQIGLKSDINYSPSVGFIYAPVEWASLFGDYNWERFDWKMRAMERTSTTQTPETNPERIWNSRGIDRIHTISLGTDLKLIQNLLGLRLQYGFSWGESLVHASGGVTPATDYPSITNRWHEFLARFEYALHKNVALRFGYYFNRYTSKDFGVDIMKPWMGDVDTGGSVQRSIFLGDQVKGNYTAHVGFVGLKLKF